MKTLIVGGGIAGVALACGLAGQGHDVTVIERELAIHGSGLGFWPYLASSLKQLGVYDEVHASGHLAERVLMCDRNGNVVTENVREDGTRLHTELVIARPTLIRLLREIATDRGAKYLQPVTYIRLENSPTGVRAQLSDGTNDTFDLVVAADGANSEIRTNFINSVSKPMPGAPGFFRALIPHDETLLPVAHVFEGSRKLVFIYPTGSGKAYAGLYVSDPEPHMDQEETTQRGLELLEEFNSPQVDHLRKIVSEDSSMFTYRRVTTHLVPAPWYRDRIVLIGDAAHTMPPNVSGGASMAIEDAAALSESVRRNPQIDEALADFMSARFDRVESVVRYAGEVLSLGPMLNSFAANSPVHDEMIESLLGQVPAGEPPRV
ncbi:FAD-dependent monooxygenase [Agromyces laixinhei]|uniref:FAD-dependent monooxygenase n=1 Tax=Agromyces laixinhei TaxID=2585717 RepID=UPI0012EEA733|nr:FAD-dependent monooxygenase [Agromyces laixinhei]